MKKILLAVIAASMLLTNVAFASTKITHTNTSENSTVPSINKNGIIYLDSQDPYP